MIRRVILSALIVFQWQSGMVQNTAFIVVCAAVLIWTIALRKFCHKVLNIQETIIEVALCVIHGIYFMFMNEESEKVSSGRYHIFGVA